MGSVHAVKLGPQAGGVDVITRLPTRHVSGGRRIRELERTDHLFGGAFRRGRPGLDLGHLLEDQARRPSSVSTAEKASSIAPTSGASLPKWAGRSGGGLVRRNCMSPAR